MEESIEIIPLSTLIKYFLDKMKCKAKVFKKIEAKIILLKACASELTAGTKCILKKLNVFNFNLRAGMTGKKKCHVSEICVPFWIISVCDFAVEYGIL